jgi:hypothetical protein
MVWVERHKRKCSAGEFAGWWANRPSHFRLDMRLDVKTIILGALVSCWPAAANLLASTMTANHRKRFRKNCLFPVT